MAALVIVVDLVIGLLAVVLLLLSAFFCLQVVLGRKRPSSRELSPRAQAIARPRISVLIPAHNEGEGLVATLDSLRTQLLDGDRLLVVADNCSDDTARVAARHGAEVVERNDVSLRGKGYALDFGYRHLLQRPFDVLLIVDADCLLDPAAVNILAREAMAHGRPVQGLYLMLGLPEDGARQRIAEFAWRVRNWARPAGMAALGMPCQLMGTGMAFPVKALEGSSFATGHIVEDLQLGLQLASRGTAPMFCDQVLVTSEFPRDDAARQAQRARWEHGHLSMILHSLPGFMRSWRRNPSAHAMALFMDVAIPPLTLLVLVAGGVGLLALVWCAVGGAAWPSVVAGLAIAVLGAGLAMTWSRYGRDLVGGRELLGAAGYLLWKIPVFLKYATGRQTEWVRAKREREHEHE